MRPLYKRVPKNAERVQSTAFRRGFTCGGPLLALSGWEEKGTPAVLLFPEWP